MRGGGNLMNKIALYAGSFDPITNGHMDIISRASDMFDELTVGIIGGLKSALFTLEERKNIVSMVTKEFPNVRVTTFDGLLADYVKKEKFDFVVRGLRNTSDFNYEIQMAQMNARLYGEFAETIFLMTDPRYSFISSSLVKEVALYGGDTKGLLPDYSEMKLIQKYRDK